jgi:PhzF family phenazine biosynthesis protein
LKLNYYQIDTFTDKLFGGNPAIVVHLREWLDDELLQNIAKENSVDATAFFINNGNEIELRWFTPDLELDLCGHATLATAHVIRTIIGETNNTLTFNTNSGQLHVNFKNDLIEMNLPTRIPIKTELPNFIKESLSKQPREVLKSRDYLLIYDNEEDVVNIEIDRHLFDSKNIDPGGVIISALGNKSDFVSRFFVPQASIFEDPVTGSAHASLIPYWSKVLDKKEMYALQLSERKGELFCTNKGSRVLISGNAKTYASGTINL